MLKLIPKGQHAIPGGIKQLQQSPTVYVGSQLSFSGPFGDSYSYTQRKERIRKPYNPITYITTNLGISPSVELFTEGISRNGKYEPSDSVFTVNNEKITKQKDPQQFSKLQKYWEQLKKKSSKATIY